MIKHISEIKNIESGSLLLIGGGTSVRDFDFTKVPDDVKRMSVNWSFVDTRIDYLVYTDSFFAQHVSEIPFDESVVFIGLDRNIFDGADYFFTFDDIREGFHTGYYALQIAEYLGFKKIYLIGYDYCADENGRLHYYEGNGLIDITDQEKSLYNKELNKGLWLKDFDHNIWDAEIYNCNPKSKLKKFKFINEVKT